MRGFGVWFSTFQTLERLETLAPKAPDGQRYPRYVRARAGDQRWKGPYYLRAKRWRHDLLLVVEQIRLNVKSNVPLSPAFAQAAQDYLAAERGWTPPRVWRTFQLVALGILVLLSLLAAVVEIEAEGTSALPELIVPAFFAVWLYRAARHQRYKPAAVFASLQARIESGHSLSEAMARLPRFFPRNLVTMVEMGERTGRLETVLDRFSAETVQKWTAQRDLTRILWYFAAVIGFQLGIIAFLLVKVIPVFYDVLDEVGVSGSGFRQPAQFPIPLPSTDTIVFIADQVIYTYSGFIVLLFWAIALWVWIRPNLKRRNWTTHPLIVLLLAVPGFRGMIARHNLGTGAFMLHEMLEAGVPLEQALDAVARSDLHVFYRRWFAHVRKRVLNGNTLRDACAGIRPATPVPRSFVSLVGMGEAHGRLESALAYLSETYHAHVERRKRMLVSGVIPLGVFIAGYIALSIEVSLFSSMISLAEAIVP